jgi:hypothetical protein
MTHTRMASLRRALPGIGIAAVAVFAAFAVATGSGSPGPVYAGSANHSMAGMDMGSMQGPSYWQNVSGGAFQSDGKTRTYYISADQVVWDYAPLGTNEITGGPFDDVADTYVKNGPGRIGSRYEKCLYRGYTDGSFTQRASRPADERHLGLLGPVIRAEVGDTIKVVSGTRARSRQASTRTASSTPRWARARPTTTGRTARRRTTTPSRRAARTRTAGRCRRARARGLTTAAR